MHDALDRPVSLTYPTDAEGRRRELRPHYDAAGALERVELDDDVVVERLAYDARGRRVLAVVGNGLLTRYGYDPRGQRLTRLRTHGHTRPDPLTYRPTGPARQDLAYVHDLVGNVESILERTSGCGVPGGPGGPDELRRDFGYDPRYRLVSATGRECALTADPSDPAPRCSDADRTRSYQQGYTYDEADNLVAMRHTAGASSSTRVLTLAEGSNRLARAQVGSTTVEYTYDAAGHVVGESPARHLTWDHADRMREFRLQPGTAVSLRAVYLYDGAGRRVKKLVRTPDRTESTVYIDELYEHTRVTTSGRTDEHTVLNVADDQARVARIRAGTPLQDDPTPPLTYEHTDHLGSVSLVTDEAGRLVDREEFTPYGETSFGSYAHKRYRFTGQERDGESGLAHHGARAYAPWLGRWTSPDPAGPVDGTNLYSYARGNPMRFVDPTGHDSQPDAAAMKRFADASPEQRATMVSADTLAAVFGWTTAQAADFQNRVKECAVSGCPNPPKLPAPFDPMAPVLPAMSVASPNLTRENPTTEFFGNLDKLRKNPIGTASLVTQIVANWNDPKRMKILANAAEMIDGLVSVTNGQWVPSGSSPANPNTRSSIGGNLTSKELASEIDAARAPRAVQPGKGPATPPSPARFEYGDMPLPSSGSWFATEAAVKQSMAAFLKAFTLPLSKPPAPVNAPRANSPAPPGIGATNRAGKPTKKR